MASLFFKIIVEHCAMFVVYILYSNSLDKYYIGYTSDLKRRLSEHNRKKGKFTDCGIPWSLVYLERYELKREAMKREKFIKLQKSRQYILSLLSSQSGRAFRYTEGSWVRAPAGSPKLKREVIMASLFFKKK
jgi:putative endonuclease